VLGIEPLVAVLRRAAQLMHFSWLRPRSKVWHLPHVTRFLPGAWTKKPTSSCTVLGKLLNILSLLSSLFGSRKREGALSCQNDGSRTRDTRMDQGTGCGAHHMVERRNLRQRNRSAAERYEKCSHRQSLPPPTAEAPAVVSDSIGRPECHPTGATGSGNVQLATRRDGRRRFSLLRCGGCPRETLLSDALQSGLSTGSQEPKGCCGRLTHGSRQEAGLKRHFTRLSFRFDGSPLSPASITILSSRCQSAHGWKHRRPISAHRKEVDLSTIARGTVDASAMQ
jgi:hypothetical protein